MKKVAVTFWKLLSSTFHEFNEDRGIKLSASLSYYTVFALPPLLIIVVSLCGIFFGREAVRGEIFDQINDVVGNAAALEIQKTIRTIHLSNNGPLAATLGVILLFIGASGVFAEIQDSINFIWGLRAKPKRGFVRYVINRLISFAMIGTVGFLLLVSLIANSLMDLLGEHLEQRFDSNLVFIVYVLNLVFVFAMTTALFMIIFKALPDARLKMRDCMIGAAFTAVLFMVGKFLISYYLGHSRIGWAYGTAGSVILVMVWVYYSAIILYFGAEFTKMYAETHGHKIIPNKYSVRILKEDIELDGQNLAGVQEDNDPETRKG
ncbi:MAG TPA: YihY/virulence factor BrkB family protein [Flavobacteriales bacterium]|nr:YihY/virulence factor BrkB family protein [Flavobacteriales bacterium]